MKYQRSSQVVAASCNQILFRIQKSDWNLKRFMWTDMNMTRLMRSSQPFTVLWFNSYGFMVSFSSTSTVLVSFIFSFNFFKPFSHWYEFIWNLAPHIESALPVWSIRFVCSLMQAASKWSGHEFWRWSCYYFKESCKLANKKNPQIKKYKTVVLYRSSELPRIWRRNILHYISFPFIRTNDIN